MRIFGSDTPIHFILGLDILRPNGVRWDVWRIERLIRKPSRYPTPTTKLCIIVPNLMINFLYLDQLQTMLTTYASRRNLEVVIEFNDNDHPAPRVWSCFTGTGRPYRLHITVISEETVAGYTKLGLVPFHQVLDRFELVYGGFGAVNPLSSLNIDRILDLGGHVALKPEIDPRVYPFRQLYVHIKVGKRVRDPFPYPIVLIPPSRFT